MSIENEKIISWLKNQRPEVWHIVAADWNWDDGIEPLKWIAQQPECDGGTVRSIFWTSYLSDSMVADFSPEMRQKVEQWCAPEQALFGEIGKNSFNDFYRSNRFEGNCDDTSQSHGPSLQEKLSEQEANGYINWSLSKILLTSGGEELNENQFTEKELDEIDAVLSGDFPDD